MMATIRVYYQDIMDHKLTLFSLYLQIWWHTVGIINFCKFSSGQEGYLEEVFLAFEAQEDGAPLSTLWVACTYEPQLAVKWGYHTIQTEE
jgi:hypothetical protein